MISWQDVLKLCIPFIFSLILILARKIYLDRKERVAKQDALWRMLMQDLNYLLYAFSRLDDILEAVKKGGIRLIAFEVPQTPVEFASRLAELEPKNSYIYNEFAARSNILIKGVDFLRYLLKVYISSESSSKELIVKGIERQIYAIKEDLILQADAQLDILDVLVRKSKVFEVRELEQRRKNVNIARKKFEEFKDQLP